MWTADKKIESSSSSSLKRQRKGRLQWLDEAGVGSLRELFLGEAWWLCRGGTRGDDMAAGSCTSACVGKSSAAISRCAPLKYRSFFELKPTEGAWPDSAGSRAARREERFR